MSQRNSSNAAAPAIICTQNKSRSSVFRNQMNTSVTAVYGSTLIPICLSIHSKAYSIDSVVGGRLLANPTRTPEARQPLRLPPARGSGG